MKERLTVDSIMTADGEVVPLPVLGPLGPVDAEGGRIPLDTKELLDAHGECRKVESYEFSTWSQRWVVHFDSGPGSYADDCHLTPPDSLERPLGDLGEALQQGGRSGHPACAYRAARGLCCGHMGKDGKCRLFDADYCVSGMVSNIRGHIKRLCAGDGKRDGSEK